MYTLVLHPETFVFSDDCSFLLYSTKSHQCLECEHSPFADKLFNDLNQLSSLYRVCISPSDYDQHSAFIDRIVVLGLGSLYDKEEDAPYSYAPILNLNYDFSGLDRLHESHEDYYLLRFLHEITFFLSGDRNNKASFSQVALPLSGTSQRLADNQLFAFLDKAHYCNIKKINLMASSPEDLDTVELFTVRATKNNPVHLYLRMGSILPKRIIDFWRRNPNIKIHLIGFIDEISPEIKNLNHEVLIENEASMNKLDEHPEINLQRIIPYYLGDNDFFRRHIGIEKPDILAVDKNDIFIRQTLNPHFFGKLFVFPDGTVSDSHFGERLGDINEMIHTLIRREIEKKGMWFLTRDKTSCHSCRFRYLCPSPSTYEVFLDRFDLCFLSST